MVEAIGKLLLRSTSCTSAISFSFKNNTNFFLLQCN
ncbi:hypothetical protein SLEP1_g28399 [Rubroshorea leprosula]|uniref:Uncharacterized protein n=1 Tax=Rubroshorea leprosula TaxID=152421 RepID=A0AAV5K2X1_9ROSI|nr:hypothetical protein SLEP1_g28399 [Rubroshorea leprosula]